MRPLLYLLSFFSFFSHFGVSMFGLNAKYDQLVTIVIVLVFALSAVVLRRGIYVDWAGAWLLMLCLLSFVASAMNAPDPRYSLIQTANLFSVSLIYFVIPNVMTTHEHIN